MAEYTLLKKYPNLPKNWEVGMLVGIGDGKSAYTPCSSKYVVMQIAAENVQNFPEYWEKVKEKEYEILGKWLILSKITKIKYLFTSDDSIGIMKGDEYVTVAKSNFDITEGNIANTVPDNQLFWRFKTKEAAKDWVLMNKPTFSVNDLSHFINVNEESHTILARRFLTAHMSTNKSNEKDF